MRNPLTRLALLGLVVLVGCGTESPAPQAQSPETTGQRSGPVPGIELPISSREPLAQAPAPGTPDGVMIAGVYALVSDGLAAYATVVDVTEVKSDDGQLFVSTRLRIDDVLLGTPPGDEITIVAGYPEVAMEPGSVVAVIVGADSTIPGSYSFVEANTLFDAAGDGRWTSRSGELTLTDLEFRSLFAESQAHLDQRRHAGSAKLALTPVGDDPYQIEVSGYADGETLTVQVCAIDETFDPVSSARSCDGTQTESITPEESTFVLKYVPLERLQVGGEEFLSCAEVQCALVVHDIDFPSTVFATYRP